MALCGTVVGNNVNIKIALSRDKMCILIKILVGDLVVLEEVIIWPRNWPYVRFAYCPSSGVSLDEDTVNRDQCLWPFPLYWPLVNPFARQAVR